MTEWVGVSTDITDTKRTADALRVSEERFRAIFAHAPSGMAQVALNGRWLRVNERLSEMVGYTAHELQALTFPEITHPDDVAADQRHIEDMLTGTTASCAFEKRYVRKDGATLWATVTMTLVRDADDDKPHYFIAVIEDISARKRLERRAHEALNALLDMAHALVEGPENDAGESEQDAMRRTARRLAELTCDVLECQRINISIVDPVTDLVQPLTIVGLSPDEERRWWETQTEPRPLDATPAPDLIAALRAGEPVIVDMRQPPFADRPNPYAATTVLVAPMRVNEQLVGLLTLDHGTQAHAYTPDEVKLAGAVAQLAALVIERERLQRERAEAQANEIALREANRRMDEFLGIASHEIKTPLTAIKASMQMAQRRADKSAGSGPEVAAAVRDVLERGERQVGRLTRLVDDLLDVARIQANKLELRPERCDLAAIVRDAVDEQRNVNPQRTISLVMPEGAQVLIKADPDRIGQVVSNYLTNALKYSPETQPVAVTLRLEGKRAFVLVRDEGPGLAPAEQERIWQRFYRAQGVTVQSGAGVGLGLGLHISRTIIERSHGEVGIASIPGQGATFWFSLPIVK